MKNLKSLSKKLFLISFIFIFISNSFAEDKPSDIWSITEQQKQETINTKELSQDINESGNEISENSIYKMQPKKVNNMKVISRSFLLNNFEFFIRDYFLYVFFWRWKFNFI